MNMPADILAVPETVTVTGIQNVLVIDDEESMRFILKETITELGYAVTSMDDTIDIEKALTQSEFQLVVLDINMPHVDGRDLLRLIKSKFPMTLVIMVTGVQDMKTVIETMKCGAVDYLNKPIDPDELSIAIRRADEIYVLKRENQEYRNGLEKLVKKRTDQLDRFADALSKKNQTIVKTNKELQKANEQMEGFLNQAMMSDKISTLGLLSSMLIHGIANPLGVISGIADVLQKRFQDEITQKELEMMKVYINQTLDLVNQVRSFARTEINQFSRIDLADVLNNSVRLIELLNKKKAVTISANLPSGTWIVHGSRSQLEQVFVNVIQNAVDAIEESGSVEIFNEPTDRGKCQVVIRDSGTGMGPEQREKIFKMFFTTKADAKGTGLGLFICKEIMEKHNGSIKLDSQVGKGTAVLLNFKLADV